MFGAVAQAAALVAFAGGVTGTTSPPGLTGATVLTSATALSGAAAAIRATAVPNTATPAAAIATTAIAASASAAPTGTDEPDASARHAPQASRPFAAPEAVNAPTAPTAGGLAQVTFALLIVLVAIFAVAWIARRMRGFNNRVGGAIDVLADVPLGQKERAVLLKVGSKQILLGVAPGRVNTLHVLDEPLELSKPSSGPNDPRPNFKQLMLRSLGK
jgi:flagellar protein FliO/FliZ